MVCLILLSACIISGVATGKVYIDIHKFIKKFGLEDEFRL